MPHHPLSRVLAAYLAWLAIVRQDPTLAPLWLVARNLLGNALEVRRFCRVISTYPAAATAWVLWIHASLEYTAGAEAGPGVCVHPLGLARSLTAPELARFADRCRVRGLAPLGRSLALVEGETLGEVLARGLRTAGPDAEALLLSHGLLSAVSPGFAERELWRCIARTTTAPAAEVACG